MFDIGSEYRNLKHIATLYVEIFVLLRFLILVLLKVQLNGIPLILD